MPTITKQSAVNGDICPIGAPPTDPDIFIPIYSACRYIPKLEKTRSSKAMKIPINVRRDGKRVIRRALGNRKRRNRAAPYNKKSKAVLGAIGIPPGQRAVSHWFDENQPIKANRLKTTVKEEE